MNHSEQSPPNSSILWRQVTGLAVIQGSITLTWMIYRIYLPSLLAGFGFSGLDKPITILEDSLNIFLEPIMGSLSDQQRHWLGTRFPFIALGVILSSALFIAIPVIFIFGKPFLILRLVFPIVLILWAISMAIFRSPATALLGQYATKNQLPKAMSLLVLVGGLASAFRPLSSKFILNLGSGITFTIGSLVLLGAVAILRAVNPDQKVTQITPESSLSDLEKVVPLRLFALLGLMGIMIGWGTRLMMTEILPKVFILKLEMNGNIAMTFVGISLAFIPLIVGIFASRFGNYLLTLIGMITSSLLLFLLGFSQGNFLLILIITLLIGSYSLVTNGVIPLILSIIPSHKSGLAIGIYFGGFSLAMSLYGLILTKPEYLSLFVKGNLAAISFFMAGIFCVLSHSLKLRLNLSSIPPSAD